MNQPQRNIYRFADVEVDIAHRCVRRDGKERHLRQQTFQVLVYLLEHWDRPVTKDELLRNIWNGTAVTDDALVQCVTDIRKALGDDSRHPRFIKTIPKVGYRFIGPIQEESSAKVTTVETEEITSAIELEEAYNGKEIDMPHIAAVDDAVALARPTTSSALFSRKSLGSIVVGVLFLAVAVASIIYFRQKSQASRHLAGVTLSSIAGKRPLAVMYFDNQSGDSELNWLREGLADMIITSLSREKNLTVLSRQQLHLMLDRLGHKESQKIQLDEALNIAQRSKAQIVILGSFARLGEQIRIDVHLHDARDGQLLTAERLVVDQPAQILTQVDLLSLKLASLLGMADEQEANAGLTGVMTNNLEAYRYYSLGVEKANALHNAEAIALLEKALALDGEFAMAYARIGYIYVNWNHADKAKPYLEKALQLFARLTEKDELYITAWYASANSDHPAAIQSFRQIVARYPLEGEAYLRLGVLLQADERFEEAIEVLKQGLIIDSGAKELYNTLGGCYLDLGRHDEAIAMYRRYVELAPEEPNAHDSLASGYEWAGRYPEAIAEYERALQLKPDFEFPIIHLGNSYFQQGRYQEATEQYQRYIQVALSDYHRVRGLNSIAHIQLTKGNLGEAERAAKAAVKHDKNAVNQLFLIALERNDLATAAKYKDVIEGSGLTNRAKGFVRELYCYRGFFDLKRGRAAEAIENFKEALRHRPLIWNLDALEDCLANAYLELGHLDEAIAEYERILHLNPNYPLVHYHLANAYERKGQSDQARAAYQRFLQVWKDADADVPEMINARRILSRQS